MPRHPPCALTHLPTTHHPPPHQPHPPESRHDRTAANWRSVHNACNKHKRTTKTHHTTKTRPAPAPKDEETDQTLDDAVLRGSTRRTPLQRCSRPLCSSQQTTRHPTRKRPTPGPNVPKNFQRYVNQAEPRPRGSDHPPLTRGAARSLRTQQCARHPPSSSSPFHSVIRRRPRY